MDPITHVLAGYVLGTALDASGALLGWTVLMAVFPDVDTVSWALPGRVRWLRHRGVTHSLPVGVAASAAGAAAISGVGLAPLGAAFAAGMIGFLSHVALDWLNWGCLILWPLRREGVEFTVQAGLMGPLVASSLGFVAILASAPLGLHDVAVAIVGGLWTAYLVAKALLKATLLARHGPDADVHPTSSPVTWRVVVARRDAGEHATSYRRATFAPWLREREVFTSRHRIHRPPLPLRSPEDAAAFTFNVPEVQSLAARDRALGVDVEPDGADGWIARWYALAYETRGGCYGALVRVAANGAYEARRGLIPFMTRAGGGDAA